MNPNILVSEIMTQMPVTVVSTAVLTEINRVFEEHSFHHLPVVDRGSLVGIISRQDFLQMQHVLSSGWNGTVKASSSYENFLAKDVMTEYPMCLSPDDTVGLAADIFLTNKFHALPILEDQILVGIVTSHDLLDYAFMSPIEH